MTMSARLRRLPTAQPGAASSPREASSLAIQRGSASRMNTVLAAASSSPLRWALVSLYFCLMSRLHKQQRTRVPLGFGSGLG
jgi:hypothetical protein